MAPDEHRADRLGRTAPQNFSYTIDPERRPLRMLDGLVTGFRIVRAMP